MVLMTLFLAFIVGLWNKPAKVKSMRTGRCSCNPLCLENPMECPLNSEVWNSILILSCLSALLPVTEGHAMQALLDIQTALRDSEHLFKNSTAHLYTPKIDNIEGCTYRFFDCFLMEMIVVLHEENATFPHGLRINGSLQFYSNYNCSIKYPCELQELNSSSEFFKAMETFLQKQISFCQKKQKVTCN